MYCPKCSQQQVSDDVRFCSRCGFQLGVVKELLVQNNIPAVNEEARLVPHRALRKREVAIGALLMLIVALLVVFASPAIPPVRNSQVFFLLVLWLALLLFINFINPLLRAVNKLFLDEDSSPTKKSVSPSHVAPGLITRVNTAINNSALPPSQSMPVTNFGSPRVETAEMVRPPSVTEGTTRLLDN